MLKVALTVLIAYAGYAQEIQKVPIQLTPPNSGKAMFTEYCAVCHGSGGKGDGPAADALKKRPADLTQLARKNGGSYPELHVMNFIKGDDIVASHGSRDMPVWGNIFSQMSSNRDLVQVRTVALTKYIEQMQAK